MNGAGKRSNLRLVQPGVQGRSRSRRGRRLRRALSLLLAVSLLSGLGFLLYRGHALFCKVEQIKVDGVDRLSRSAIIESSGVKKGTSLLFLSPRKIEQRLAELPEVSSAAVERKLPGVLVIRVQEREAAAILLAGERFWLVDGEGVIFAEETRLVEELLIVTGLTTGEIALGEAPADRAKHEALVAFLEALPEKQLLEAVELNLSDPQELILYTVDRRKVLLGDCKNMVQKMTLLQEAALHLPGNGAAGGGSLDLRAADQLVLVAD